MRLTISPSSGGTGGASYTEVANFAALPAAAGASGDIYVVLAGSGVWFVNRKAPGLYQSDGAAWNYLGDIPEDYFLSSVQTRSFGITIDGAGQAITTGVKGYLEIPYACTITGWTLVANESGSIVIDVWNDTYANFPPVDADSIAGTELPTLSSAQKNQDLSLSTWDTAVAAGDVVGFNVDSCTGITRCTLVIHTSVAA